MNPVFLTLLCVPIILAIILYISLVVKQKYTKAPERRYYHEPTNPLHLIWGKVGAALLFGMLIVAIFFALGTNYKTHDVEILNGEVTGKEREHDHYVHSYSCNCKTVTHGSGDSKYTTTECDTCYEDRYTVTWYCYTNLKNFTIEHLDKSSKRVYETPDPRRYVVIQKGDPVSISNSYINWIKAVPDSLMKPLQTFQVEKYAGKIPPYPGDIYDIYKIDRVIGVGVTVPNARDWNDKLSRALRTMGPQRQANAIIVFTNEPDAMYAEALRDAWVNGKKNDIVVVIGVDSFSRPAKWVKILALTKENIFQINLRDRLLNLPSLTSELVVNTIFDETHTSYARKSMHDFSYLENEILPSTGFIVTIVILNLLLNIGLFFIKFE